MAFTPSVNLALTIDGTAFQVAGQPERPGTPVAIVGSESIIYRLATVAQPDPATDATTWRALKIFAPEVRPAGLTAQAERLAALAGIPGLAVARRTVIEPRGQFQVLRRTPDLIDSIVMPWIAGPTWAEVVQARRLLTEAETARLARALASTLAELERRGCAHGDVCGVNLLLPGLSDHADEAATPTQLVDLEDLYSADAPTPDPLPNGTPGYAHETAHSGLWQPELDRFAGAVVLAEILGWSDSRVRALARGATYFEPRDMQQDGERYRALRDALAARGERLAWLFRRAWESSSLAECPTLSDWLAQLTASSQPAGTAEPSLPRPPVAAGLSRPRAPVGPRPPVGPIPPPPIVPTPVDANAPTESVPLAPASPEAEPNAASGTTSSQPADQPPPWSRPPVRRVPSAEADQAPPAVVAPTAPGVTPSVESRPPDAVSPPPAADSTERSAGSSIPLVAGAWALPPIAPPPPAPLPTAMTSPPPNPIPAPPAAMTDALADTATTASPVADEAMATPPPPGPRPSVTALPPMLPPPPPPMRPTSSAGPSTVAAATPVPPPSPAPDVADQSRPDVDQGTSTPVAVAASASPASEPVTPAEPSPEAIAPPDDQAPLVAGAVIAAATVANTPRARPRPPVGPPAAPPPAPSQPTPATLDALAPPPVVTESTTSTLSTAGSTTSSDPRSVELAAPIEDWSELLPPPEPAYAALALHELGQRLAAGGDAASAAAVYRRALALAPADGPLARQLGAVVHQ